MERRLSKPKEERNFLICCNNLLEKIEDKTRSRGAGSESRLNLLNARRKILTLDCERDER